MKIKLPLNHLTLFLLTYFIIGILAPVNAQVYKDSTAKTEDRVEDLLGRMTLDEKVGQMAQAERAAFSDITEIKNYFLGSLLSGGGSAPSINTGKGWADMFDLYQKQAMNTRLGIPLIYGIDAVHGHNNVKNATIFPHNIGLGCTRNPELVKEAAHITALEIMGTGLNWDFAPCIAVARNERWGRTYEAFGETPELVTELGKAAVLGYQGDSLMGKSSIVACAKHYMGDGGTQDGDDQGNTIMDEATLRRIHLPAYIEAVKAKVGTVMASYSSWNGAKMHGHKYLLTDVLKTELGFDGFVVSDYAAIDQLPGTYSDQVQASINAGVDMVMLPNNYVEFTTTLKTLVNNGKVPLSRIDDAVRRILRIKFRAGLFEHPYADRTYTNDIGSDAHREVARQCVRESLVLLKKKDNVLPLGKDGHRIMVAGKNADNIGNQCGGWTISWQGGSGDITKGTSVLDAIESALGTSMVMYSADGTGAPAADVAVAVIGETPYAEGQGDRDDLNLSSEDIELVRTLKKAGIPVIVVLISGRPMLLNPILPFCDAIIAAWLPGTEGKGISDVLFGDYQPKGLLSNSWPNSMAQIPVNFGDPNYNPLFAYGYGITSLANSTPGSAPEFYAASTTADGSAVEVSFNKAIDASSVSADGFVVYVNSMPVNIKGASVKNSDNSVILISPEAVIGKGDAIRISYSGTAIKSADGGVLNEFSYNEVYNLSNDYNYLTIPGKIEAEDYSNMAGVQTENTSDAGGGLNVGYIDNGDWMDYLINIPSDGNYEFNFRVASQSAAGKITLKLDGVTVSSFTLPVTGGWQNWQTVSNTCRLTAGQKILRVTATTGGFNLNWFMVSVITSVDDEKPMPTAYNLAQNFPNPFNPVTSIQYSIPDPGNVKLTIYDMLGREVAVLVNKEQSAGTYNVKFDAGSLNLSSGMYIYKLQAGSFSETKKLMLLK
jgi:beta-glucosidase